MRIDQNVVHRKVIAPWYDSEISCFITVFVLFFVFLFSISGLSVASEKIEYHEFVWVPIMLLLMSAGTIISIIVRVVRRYVSRIQNRYLKNFSHNAL